MKMPSPRLCLVLGGLFLIGGLIYDLRFAGIPYQDPTAEMTARYDFHSGVASAIRWIGAAALVFGLATLILGRFRR